MGHARVPNHNPQLHQRSIQAPRPGARVAPSAGGRALLSRSGELDDNARKCEKNGRKIIKEDCGNCRYNARCTSVISLPPLPCAARGRRESGGSRARAVKESMTCAGATNVFARRIVPPAVRPPLRPVTAARMRRRYTRRDENVEKLETENHFPKTNESPK
ncbi:hypothetical protein EVAR_17838_1 [Eumeta japonica]|uniref:Uncharacterized protein n=1 Tax=Eumeta variegata TaxID=151549 RepID=A0A4C1TTL1_EUMVA|nr:hypothetical protein EVAR_17838_1 [Eumeta japonica]